MGGRQVKCTCGGIGTNKIILTPVSNKYGFFDIFNILCEVTGQEWSWSGGKYYTHPQS